MNYYFLHRSKVRNLVCDVWRYLVLNCFSFLQPILQGARAIIAFARSTGGGVVGGEGGQFLLIERSQAGAIQALPFRELKATTTARSTRTAKMQ